jgi:hypothetical protein
LKLLPLLVGRTVLSTASLDGSRVSLGVPLDHLRLTEKVQAQVKAAAQGGRSRAEAARRFGSYSWRDPSRERQRRVRLA